MIEYDVLGFCVPAHSTKNSAIQQAVDQIMQRAVQQIMQQAVERFIQQAVQQAVQQSVRQSILVLYGRVRRV